MEDIVKFAYNHNLILLSDEVFHAVLSFHCRHFLINFANRLLDLSKQLVRGRAFYFYE